MFTPHVIDGIGLAEILAASNPPPIVLKVQNPKLEVAKLALSADVPVIAKDMHIAHDWRGYSGDPVALADEHAERISVYSEYTGITHWESFNEPIPHNQKVIDWLISHELRLAQRLAPRGITVYVLGLSVGWPNESVGGSDWWAPFDRLFANWLPNMVISVGEYFPYPTGPDDGWGYLAGRLIHMPSNVWPIIGKPFLRECGQDRVENGVHKFYGNTHGNIDLFVEHMFRFKVLYEQSGIEPMGASIFTCGRESADWQYTDYSGDLDVMMPLWQARYVAAAPAEHMIRVKMPDGTVQVMEIEEYLRAVVPAEMPARWPMEALKTQAIAARTYAMYAIQNPKHDDADICTTTHCHVYNPAKIHDRTDQAIRETAGVVLLYEGEIIQAFYSANCGGITRSNREAWGGDHLPYLESVKCVNPGPKYGHGVGMCQWGAHDMAEMGMSYVDILMHYYACVTLSNGVAPVPPIPVPPVLPPSVPTDPEPPEDNDMEFDFEAMLETFLVAPGYNDAAHMGVKINKVSGAKAKCIGVHVLGPDENWPNHHVLFAVVDKDGKRVFGPKIDWEWAGMKPDETAGLVPLDKPPDEPPGNLELIWDYEWVNTWVADMVSDTVTGMSIRHEQVEPGGNYRGHWSFFVAWQIGGPDVPVPDPDPTPDPDPDPPPVPTDYIARLKGVSAGLRAVERDLAKIIKDMEA